MPTEEGSESGIGIIVWANIIRKHAREFAVVVTGVASESDETVGVTDLEMMRCSTLQEAETQREVLIQAVQAAALSRGDRVLRTEMLLAS